MKQIRHLFIILMILTIACVGCGAKPQNKKPIEIITEQTDGTADQTEQFQDTEDTGDKAEEVPQAPDKSAAQKYLEAMSLEEKVYQMFIVTPEQLTGVDTVTQAGATTQNAIMQYPVGGIAYFAKNIVNPTQCKTMIANTQSYSKTPLFISVDEEGGMVARVANNPAMGTTKFPNMANIQTTDAAYNVGNTIGREIKELGFNLDFAPIADVNSNPNNPIIGVRSFSSDAQTAATLVAAAVKGFRDSNMICTLKHFPGHGDTSTDSHQGYAEVTKTLQELQTTEFVPFQAGIQAGAQFVMVGHLTAPKVTGDNLPATMSQTMISLLRDQVGFEGIIITDAMNMGAIVNYYSSAQAAVQAVQAGVDIILMPQNLQEAVNGIVQAVREGTIPESRIDESVLRILQTKSDYGIMK